MAKEVKDRIRVTVDLTTTQYDIVQQLEERLGASSKADAIREALRFYNYVIKRNKEGYKVYLDKDGDRERIPLFD